MDERVNVLQRAQAAIEGEITVARRAFWVVIEALAVEAVTTIGLQGDENISGTDRAEAEGIVGECRIVLRLAPALVDDGTLLGRQRVEPRAIDGQRNGERRLALGETRHQFVGREIPFGRITGLLQKIEDCAGAGRRVEPDREAGASTARGIIGEDQCELPFVVRRAGKAHPGGGHICNRIDAGCVRRLDAA